jgi:hypothetical protein
MYIIETHHEDRDLHDFANGRLDEFTELVLRAEQHMTLEQRENLKQTMIQHVETDRLMQAQHVWILITGAWGEWRTPWGARPIDGRAFEGEAVEALIAASEGDPFVVHALAYETGQRVTRQALAHPELLRPLAAGSRSSRLTLDQVAEVIADKEAVVQAYYEECVQR